MARPAALSVFSHPVAEMRGREDRAKNDQACERERPESQVPAEGPEATFGSPGEKQNDVATDDQARGWKQRHKIDHHGSPQCQSMATILPRDLALGANGDRRS
jgi:hypothetical protein